MERSSKYPPVPLLICPFCGGQAEVVTVTRHIDNNKVVVKCSVCGASSRTFPENKVGLARAAWNMRYRKG